MSDTRSVDELRENQQLLTNMLDTIIRELKSINSRIANLDNNKGKKNA
tara:strand:+ start:568 stop:711 length:144 start_codon:yes stop_codon:yes gene_type:complete